MCGGDVPGCNFSQVVRACQGVSYSKDYTRRRRYLCRPAALNKLVVETNRRRRPFFRGTLLFLAMYKIGAAFRAQIY